MFNALKYIRNLEAVGIRREQAEAQVQLVLDAIGDEVATKTDMAELKSELKTEIAAVKSELKLEIADLRSELKSDLAELRSEIAGVKLDVAQLKSETKAEIAVLKHELLVKSGAIYIACSTIGFTALGFLIHFH